MEKTTGNPAKCMTTACAHDMHCPVVKYNAYNVLLMLKFGKQ